MHNTALLRRSVQDSSSLAEVLRKLGLVPAGGNYASLRNAIRRDALDTSHFTGQGHLRGKTHDYKKRPLPSMLRPGLNEHTWRLKRRLLGEGYKTWRCEACQRRTWQGLPIPLELHHRDGDRTNNHLSNLQLVCPNCHAQTDNYRGKNRNV